MGEAAESAPGPSIGASVTPEGGPHIGVEGSKEGVEGVVQPRVAPYVYGPKAKLSRDGVKVDPGITVETPAVGPAGVYGTATKGPDTTQVGIGVSKGIPGVGDASAEATVPVPSNPMAMIQADAYKYDNVPIGQQDPLVLQQADQMDGGHRLQDYNDQMYGSPPDTAPGQTPPKKEHVTHCPTCPPWPNVEKKDKNGYPLPLESFEVH